MKKILLLLTAFCLFGCYRPDEVHKHNNSTDEVYKDDSGITRYHMYTKINQKCIQNEMFVDGLTVDSVQYIVHPRWIQFTVIYYNNGDNMWIEPAHYGGTARVYAPCTKCRAPADSPIKNLFHNDLTQHKNEMIKCLQN